MPEGKKQNPAAAGEKKRPAGDGWAEQTGKNPDDLEIIPESQDL